MFHSFSLAAVCCLPGHNPAQRIKERAIMTRPAFHQLRESWEVIFPEARLETPVKTKRVRAVRAHPAGNRAGVYGFTTK